MPTEKYKTLLAGLMVAGLSLGTLACSGDDTDDGTTPDDGGSEESEESE